MPTNVPLYRHLPNLLTLLRGVLAVGFFATLNGYVYTGPHGDPQSAALWAAIALFTLAALTDTLDGYLARRWKVETRFGRIMDPALDKVLVLGAFVYLAGWRFVVPFETGGPDHAKTMITGVYPWMVVVILTRELLVTAMRSEMEGRGAQFGANWSGKIKMILQSIAVPMVLLIVWLDPVTHTRLLLMRDSVVYLTVAVTIVSVWPYITSLRRAGGEPAGDDDAA